MMMPTRQSGQILCVLVLLNVMPPRAAAPAADQPQWGERHSRNMVSAETGLPDRFDPKTGRERQVVGRRWARECYATPVVAGGKVLIGTNNNQPRDPRHQGDRGVLMCFERGRRQPRLATRRAQAAKATSISTGPQAGMCSPPTVEGDRVYTVTNRDEVVCLDLHGMANGNDGPFRDEGRHMTPRRPAAAGGRPDRRRHPLAAGPAHGRRRPAARFGPQLDPAGRAVSVREHEQRADQQARRRGQARRPQPGRRRQGHGPAGRPGTRGDRPADLPQHVVVAGAGRSRAAGGWSSSAAATACATRSTALSGRPRRGADERGRDRQRSSCVWRFDCDPTAPKENVHRYIRNRRESPSNIKSMPVFHDGRRLRDRRRRHLVGQAPGVAAVHRRHQDRRHHARPACVWSYPRRAPLLLDARRSTTGWSTWPIAAARCIASTPQTGQPYWVHDAGGEIWASTLVADGKVYIGTRRGDFWVLAAGKENRVLSSIRLDDPVISTAVAANGTLYVGTMTRLYALQQGAKGGKTE